MCSEDQTNGEVVSRREFLCLAGLPIVVSVLGSTVPRRQCGSEVRGRFWRFSMWRWGSSIKPLQLTMLEPIASSCRPIQLKLGGQLSKLITKRHRDALVKYLRRFGGTPVEPKSSYDFGTITSAADILKLAQQPGGRPRPERIWLTPISSRAARFSTLLSQSSSMRFAIPPSSSCCLVCR